jgi:hypothetical protein
MRIGATGPIEDTVALLFRIPSNLDAVGFELGGEVLALDIPVTRGIGC